MLVLSNYITLDADRMRNNVIYLRAKHEVRGRRNLFQVPNTVHVFSLPRPTPCKLLQG